MSDANKKKYNLEFYFNGNRFLKQTDDIEKTLLKIAPEQLYTEMYITASFEDMKTERKLNLIEGRKLFRDDTFRQIFIQNLTIS